MTYVYDNAAAGQGTTAYVIDTGVPHRWRQARSLGYLPPDSTERDFTAHGTTVASTLAGNTFGPAKQAQVVAVKVYPDNLKIAWTSDVLKGLEWAVNDALRNGNILQCVANMSLGGTTSIIGERAVAAAVKAGLTVVFAAGNGGVNAETRSFSSSPDAIVAGSTRIDDTADVTNYGRRLDVLAPGKGIKHAWTGSPSNTATSNGTSIASAYVAGVACCLMSNSLENRGPARIIQLLKKIYSGKDQLKNVVNDNPNLILNNGHHAT